eukprot:gene1432-1806_t
MPLSTQDIDLPFLSKYFHLPINSVAKEIGICATVLKKICRKNGIPRWPHRKIKSIDKMIANLENTTPKNQEEQIKISNEIQSLKRKKSHLIKHPNILAIKSSIKQKEAELLNKKINENQFEISQEITYPSTSSSNSVFNNNNKSPYLNNNNLSVSPNKNSLTSIDIKNLNNIAINNNNFKNGTALNNSFPQLWINPNSNLPDCKSSATLSPSINSCFNRLSSSPLKHHSPSSRGSSKSSSPMIMEDSPSMMSEYPIVLPKINIPASVEFPLKTLEPIVFHPQPSIPKSKDESGLPPPTLPSLSPISSPINNNNRDSSKNSFVPLPSWFQSEHDTAIRNLKIERVQQQQKQQHSNGFSPVPSLNGMRVHQLISDVPTVPMHQHSSSPLCCFDGFEQL